MISERTLRKWRSEALKSNDLLKKGFTDDNLKILVKRILKLTQELLDQHLIRR